jgi:hypothetical protein
MEVVLTNAFGEPVNNDTQVLDLPSFSLSKCAITSV